MKKFITFFSVFMMVIPAFAVSAGDRGRRSMPNQSNVSRGVAPVHALMATAKMPSATVSTGTNSGNTNSENNVSDNSGTSTTTPDNTTTNSGNTTTTSVDTREKEKMACINNNIGMGNTFVWASRYSNTNNYAAMVEDTENPENNTCWVRVELKSADSNVKTSDIPAQYYEMGRTITCGSWANEETLKKRILDAKKSARTWGTVGGVVGGAALGVGAMELVGNKMIGGAVEGQYALSGDELILSQLAVAYKNNNVDFNNYESALRDLKKACEDDVFKGGNADQKPSYCDTYHYDTLLDGINRIRNQG